MLHTIERANIALRPRGDVWGICLASACAIHCIATPLVLGMLPLVAGALLEHPALEWLLVLLSVLLSSVTIAHGSRRHGRWYPALPLVAGAALLLAARVLPQLDEPVERAIVLAAAVLIITAHLLNLRAPRRQPLTR
jgi:hypothetical protein